MELTSCSREISLDLLVRLALQHLDTDKESYIPGLYIPSKWEPPPADANVEARLMEFDERFE